MKSTKMSSFFATCTIIAFSLVISSCSTPSVSNPGGLMQPDEEQLGGFSSNDIRTVASQVAPAVLALPEIVDAPSQPVRIALAPMKNSTRFIVDPDILMTRLRLELNRYARGQVRFFSQNNAQATRAAVLRQREEDEVAAALQRLAVEIQSSGFVRSLNKPVKVATIGALNSNLVNMNADSFLALLRSEMSSQDNEKIRFLMPGVLKGADYLMSGQFIAESMKEEAIINLAEYIRIAEARLKEGKSLAVYSENTANGATVSVSNASKAVVVDGTIQERSLLEQIVRNQSLRAIPNVTKHLSVMIVDAKTKAVAFEKRFTVSRKLTEGLGAANYVLAGELTGLSKRVKGVNTDYLIITVQLIDPLSNEMLWEGGYEVKKMSSSGIVYQ